MQNELFRHYLKVNVPPLVVFVIVYFLQNVLGLAMPGLKGEFMPFGVVVATAVFAVLAPLWYRLYFVQRVEARKGTNEEEVLRFEKNFLLLASLSMYMPIAAVLAGLSRVPFVTVVLMMFYALYYYYPSEKRIKQVRQIFRLHN